MAVKTYMRLIAILALVGLMSGTVTARRGRAAGGTRGARGGSFRGGALRAGRSSASTESFSRGRSLRAAPRSTGQSSFRGGAFGAARHSTSTRSFRGGSSGTRAYPGRQSSAESESHEVSSFRLYPYTRTYHIGRRRHYRYYGGHRRYGSGPYFYISLPYYRYYGYGYPYYYCDSPYYYYSIPYYRYYYPYSRYHYYEYYRTYDYPPRTYRRRQPCTKDDPCTDEHDKTPAQQTDKPPEQSEGAAEYVQLDSHLKDIADAFAEADYQKAARHANQALTDEPDNEVLPFVYSQALFADRKYSQAADVLREAVRNLDAENRQVFYPLGFYPDEDLLDDQIAALKEAAAAQPSNADLQLLLGYQFLGVASYDDALDALQKASADYVNKEAAAIMIDILQKARSTPPPPQIQNPES